MTNDLEWGLIENQVLLKLSCPSSAISTVYQVLLTGYDY
jgi:hypothetical protein